MLGAFGVNRPIIIRRGKLAPVNGEGEQGPPASGATITIYDQTLDRPTGLTDLVPAPAARYQFSVMSSNDSAASGVVFAETHDGTNFDTVSSQTYSAANGLTTYEYLSRGGLLKITYQNSANTLTSWRYTLSMILGDRNPGS
jgi:hypothetical protein